MRNTSFAITVQHLFSPKSAQSAERKSSISLSRFNVHKYIPQNIISLYQRIVVHKSYFTLRLYQ